ATRWSSSTSPRPTTTSGDPPVPRTTSTGLPLPILLGGAAVLLAAATAAAGRPAPTQRTRRHPAGRLTGRRAASSGGPDGERALAEAHRRPGRDGVPHARLEALPRARG